MSRPSPSPLSFCPRTLALVLAPLLVPGLAHAERRIELGVATGGHRFAADVELGVDDRMDEPGPASSVLLGLRVGLALGRRVGVEGEAALIPTEDDVVGDPVTAVAVRVHGVAYLLTGKVRPFVLAGVGTLAVRGGGPQLDDDVDPALHWGGGVRVALGRSLDARLDLRHVIVPDRGPGGATSDLEGQAGLVWSFGGGGKRPAPRPAPVVVAAAPRDRDRDGLVDERDTCPEAAEDTDDFEDQDGCPERDNDRDGLADAVDRCPREPETVNGWDDDDGCADEVLAELAGIEFEWASAKISAGSTPILDRAVALLGEHPALAIEITGHTSADGDRGFNVELSQARADAVKAYLVRRGIAADRVRAVGHGPDRPVADDATAEGRRLNRRIEFHIMVPAPS